LNKCTRCGLAPTSNLEKAVKETYGKLWASQKVRNTRGSARACLFEKLSLRKSMRILDVGSGSGETVLAVAEKVKPNGKAVGIDFSPDGIALAREKAKGRNIGNVAEFQLANALKLPFPDNYFDAVISECVICLIPDKQKALNEKVRVLKPGGKVVMHDVISWMPIQKL
jgi:ubiquinone/menaquinone biosynthesis C-methylase UbiE